MVVKMKTIDMDKYIIKFKNDLENSNDVANINSYIKFHSSFPRNRKCIAIDMGGTNVRIARVIFDEKGIPSIENKKEYHMIGAIGEDEKTIDDFFTFLANIISEYDESDVGLCFSYLCEILPNRDGKIISFSKEVKIKDAEGKILGIEANKKLKELGFKERNFSIINDTVSCMMGTEGANVGMILGTGFNICYKEKLNNDYIINSEGGRYKGFPTEDFDFGPMVEQKISGAYLRPLIKKMPHLEDEVYDRGAKMIAIELIALYYHMNEKLRIAAEGSVYYNVEKLRKRIIYYLDLYKIDYEMLDGRNKVLIGTAMSTI